MGGVPPVCYESRDHSSLSPTAADRRGSLSRLCRARCGPSGRSTMPQASRASASGPLSAATRRALAGPAKRTPPLRNST